MTDSGRTLVFLMGLAVLGGCTHMHDDLDRLTDQSRRDFDRVPEAKYTWVDLQDVIEAPTAFKLMPLRFIAITNRNKELVFAYAYSIYRPEYFHAISLWPVGAELWKQSVRLSSIPTFYIRLDNPDLQRVIDVPRFSMVDIRGWMTGDFEGVPYFTITNFDVLEPAAYTQESLADLGDAMEASRDNRPAEAIRHLEAALEGSLASPARVVAHLKLADYYEQRGDFENAIRHFAGALKIDPDNPTAQKGFDRTRKALERLRLIEAGEAPTSE